MRLSKLVLGLGVVVLGGCLADDSEPGIFGDASLMQTQPGEYVGYLLETCPGDDDTWLIVGTGDRYYRDVAPGEEGRQEAVIALGDEVLNPIVFELDSWVFTGGIGLACRSDVPALPSIGIRDWGDMDRLIEDIGQALADRELGETVEVGIEPPIVLAGINKKSQPGDDDDRI